MFRRATTPARRGGLRPARPARCPGSRPRRVFTTPTFERAIGRAAIARAEQQAYDTYFRGTRVELHVEHSALLRDDVALLHTANRIFRDEGLMVKSHAMIVLDAASGDWKIAGWHNLVPLQMPPN